MLVVKEVLFKDISNFSSVVHFVQCSKTVCAISVGGIMRNISIYYSDLLGQWLENKLSTFLPYRYIRNFSKVGQGINPESSYVQSW